MMRKIAIAAILGAALAGGFAVAQQMPGMQGMPHGQMSQPAAPGAHTGHGAPARNAADSAATRAFKAANAKMHKDMDIKYSGDPDKDFVAGMIPRSGRLPRA